MEPPYSYSSKESRRAARKRASIFAELIEEEKLEISNASPWPGGWQSRISAKSHKVRPPLHALARGAFLSVMASQYIRLGR